MLLFYLISWCGNFVERHIFCIVSGEFPKTMRKLCLSTKFSHQEIRWNNGVLRSDNFYKKTRIRKFLCWFLKIVACLLNFLDSPMRWSLLKKYPYLQLWLENSHVFFLTLRCSYNNRFRPFLCKQLRKLAFHPWCQQMQEDIF